MMQIQVHSLSHCSLTPSKLTPSSALVLTSYSSRYHRIGLVGNQHFPSRSFNSFRRLLKSQTSFRKCGSLVRVRCGMMEDESVDDGFYMRRCVELARTAIGCTSPNPMVGCVIVKDGKIVGQGFHPKAGQPHAEVFALRDAGDLAENATAYVSLEPCNHHGRTPPCTEALIRAKVKRVVVGMVDPNPIVASKGVDKLRDAGINVTVGVEEELCKRLNEAYIHQMLTGKPFVTLRYSLSINGRLLDQLGDGVTKAGGYYSKLLQEYDAVVLSGSLSEKYINPLSQEPGANQPLQIVIASNHGKPPAPTKEASKMIIFSDEITTEADLAQNGVETVHLDRINMTSILEYCKRQGLCSVLLDMRGTLAHLGELLKESVEQNVLQKIVVEMLPFWDESDSGESLMALNGLIKGLEVKNLQSNISNQSIVLEGYLHNS